MCWCGALCDAIACASPSRFFFSTDTASTEIYTLSLHDALPILAKRLLLLQSVAHGRYLGAHQQRTPRAGKSESRTQAHRSEEHTSELQSRGHLVCRLLLEKKNT